MKKSKYTEEQIAFALKQAELGAPISEVCRKLGIAEQTFYRWKNKYGGMLPSDMKRLKQLEEENAKLKKLVADLSLDKLMLQDVLTKKFIGSAEKREAIRAAVFGRIYCFYNVTRIQKRLSYLSPREYFDHCVQTAWRR